MCVRERAGGRPRLREGRGSGLTGTRVGSTCAGRVVLFSFSGETEYKIVRHKKEPLKKKKKKKEPLTYGPWGYSSHSSLLFLSLRLLNLRGNISYVIQFPSSQIIYESIERTKGLKCQDLQKLANWPHEVCSLSDGSTSGLGTMIRNGSKQVVLTADTRLVLILFQALFCEHAFIQLLLPMTLIGNSSIIIIITIKSFLQMRKLMSER